ncbi:hypothetical protein BHM03_00054466, partial [Ensete ventricosum]
NRFLDKVIYVSSSCNCHDRSYGFPRLEPDKLHLQSTAAGWLNYQRPDIKHGGFTEEEDSVICILYDRLGSRWSVVGSRTDNDVKNYWNTDLKKKKKKKKKQKKKKQANSIHCP